MEVKDLKPRQGNVDIVIDVIDVGEPREFQKFGKAGKVATAMAKDETGDIKLTLWNDDVERIKAGDKIHLVNGYVNEWQGELQLTTGRMGKLEVVGEGEVSPTKEEDPATNEDASSEKASEEKPSADEEDVKDPDEEVI